MNDDEQAELMIKENISEPHHYGEYPPDLLEIDMETDVASYPVTNLQLMVVITQPGQECSGTQINAALFLQERQTSTVSIQKKHLENLLIRWDTHCFMRQVFNENYVGENDQMVFFRYDDPLVVSTWDKWLGLKDPFVFFADQNQLEWAQSPIFMDQDFPLQDWAKSVLVGNEDKAFLVLFLNQGSLCSSALLSCIDLGDFDMWVVPMFLVNPKHNGPFKRTPCNMLFSVDFLEHVFRLWALNHHSYTSHKLYSLSPGSKKSHYLHEKGAILKPPIFHRG